jgi:major type 1 subunit fimbrin (pilin)
VNKKLIVCTLLACSAFSALSHAADGTINFTGTITDAACTVTPGTANQTVTMGTVSSTALANVGDTAAPTRFDIVLD